MTLVDVVLVAWVAEEGQGVHLRSLAHRGIAILRKIKLRDEDPQL